ncbi:MAG: DUF1850 domain-containing protein, partial [Desulfovibrionales bacterium]|nr:DUF1850 domain-containing protein [Desulfovibrionales bacterium]
MMLQLSLWAMALVCSASLCLLQLTWMEESDMELRLTLAHEGRLYLALPLAPGERFTIHYYHSVENTPIWETHAMDTFGKIYIVEERYEKFGAGMGKMPGVGRMVRRGNYEVIEDMNMMVGDFILRVGRPEVGHTLI